MVKLKNHIYKSLSATKKYHIYSFNKRRSFRRDDQSKAKVSYAAVFEKLGILHQMGFRLANIAFC